MKRAPKTLPREEAELFKLAVADAKPLKASNRARVELPRRKPAPRPLEIDAAVEDTFSDGAFFPSPDPGEPLKFSRPGLQRSVLRELRRGRSIEAELDLHGVTVSEARKLLAQFLVECREGHLRCVRVIHGKGLRSENREGVLKASVASWLTQWSDVLAFHEAPAREGGGGAVIVLLRTSG